VLDARIHRALGIYDGIDMLVNDAGYIEAGHIEDISHERLLAALNTNFLDAINVTKSFLPHFRQKRSGMIVFTRF